MVVTHDWRFSTSYFSYLGFFLFSDTRRLESGPKVVSTPVLALCGLCFIAYIQCTFASPFCFWISLRVEHVAVMTLVVEFWTLARVCLGKGLRLELALFHSPSPKIERQDVRSQDIENACR